MKKTVLSMLLMLPMFSFAGMQQITVNLFDTSTFSREMGTSDFVHRRSDMRITVRAKQSVNGQFSEKTDVQEKPSYMVDQDLIYSISVPSKKMGIIDNTSEKEIDILLDAKYEVAPDFSKIDIRLRKDALLEAYGAKYEAMALDAASKLIGAASSGQASFKTRISDMSCESDLATLVCESGITVKISVRQ